LSAEFFPIQNSESGSKDVVFVDLGLLLSTHPKKCYEDTHPIPIASTPLNIKHVTQNFVMHF